MPPEPTAALYEHELILAHFPGGRPTLEQVLEALAELGELTVTRWQPSARNPKSYVLTLRLPSHPADIVRDITQLGATLAEAALRCLIGGLQELSLAGRRGMLDLETLLARQPR